MAATLQEYRRFLVWLGRVTDAQHADVRRLANIILAHFEEIAAVDFYQSRRSIRLARLLRQEIATAPDVLPADQGTEAKGEAAWKRLRHLIVGPFRGFRQPEQFELDKRIVLFYGPNGSGKTSLCEALEYSLLRSVSEAEARRIDPDSYLSNLHEGWFLPPELKATRYDGSEVDVVPNADEFRFCFVEKNRIEAFSRIASRTAQERSELVAALFGIEGFNQFVSDFNESLDGQLTLAATKRLQLELRQTALTADRAVVDGEATALIGLDEEEAALAAAYQDGLSYPGLLTLIGTAESPGRLKELDDLLLKRTPIEWNVTEVDVLAKLAEANRARDQLDALQAQLQQRRSEVSFKDLYQAVLNLQEEIRDRCPACDTPLKGRHSVARDPYDKARAGLAELEQLSLLQEQEEEAQQLWEDASHTLRQAIRRIADFAREHAPDEGAVIRAVDGVRTDGRWWAGLMEAPGEGQLSLWGKFILVAQRIEQRDAEVRQSAADRTLLIGERACLNQLNLRVAEQRTKRSQLAVRVAEAAGRIEAFRTENQQLISEVASEAEELEQCRRFKAAYDAFVVLIRRYRQELPSTLMAGLNEATMALYNGFNRDDPESDKLAKLKLPVSNDGRIEVAFNADPERFVDALHILSEGHIRCLGLAILLAKNIELHCPTVIFDDAVNAIDHDHRFGIRNTLFTNPSFADKQIVVTCHGEEFIKDVEVMIGSDVAAHECVSYTFLPHTGDNFINVQEAPSRNYVLEAQREFSAGRVRNALAAARRAMESVNNRTWRLLERLGLGEIKVKMDRPKAPLDQNDIANALKGRIDSKAFTHAKKQELSTGLAAVLVARNWACLNAGTHEGEDIEDFDKETVRQVLQNIASLDAVLARSG